MGSFAAPVWSENEDIHGTRSLLIHDPAHGTENIILSPWKRSKFYVHIATGGFIVLVLIRFPYEVANGSSSKEGEPGTSIQQEIKSIPGIIFKKQFRISNALFSTHSLPECIVYCATSKMFRFPALLCGSSQLFPSVGRNVLCENTFFLCVRGA